MQGSHSPLYVRWLISASMFHIEGLTKREATSKVIKPAKQNSLCRQLELFHVNAVIDTACYDKTRQSTFTMCIKTKYTGSLLNRILPRFTLSKYHSTLSSARIAQQSL